MLHLNETCRSSLRRERSGRREFLRVGGSSWLGLTLADLLKARAAAAESGHSAKQTSIVMLFLEGGASQFETFDPKPDAPLEYRGSLGSIPTRLPGVEFGGLFPKLAQLADKMTIVRSFTHADGDHGGAAHWVKTGHPWPPQFFGKSGLRIPQTSPSIGSVISRVRGPVHPNAGVPTYVCMRTIPGYEGDDAAWLGQASTPFRLGTASNTMLANMSLTLPRERLADRRALLNSLDRLDRRDDSSGVMVGMDGFQEQAVRVIQGQARQAFDLSHEDARLRDRYGPGLGQELLLARRLCEAGVGFVTINNSTSGEIDGWDHHKNIFPSCQLMCPLVDHAVSVFIEDLYARGMDHDVLLIVTGEFGRTPRINKEAGRDHWAALNPLLLVGGGLKMGQVLGASDAKGAFPLARPVSPEDLMATCFHVLGIAQTLHFTNPAGQPVPIIYGTGQPIEELL